MYLALLLPNHAWAEVPMAAHIAATPHGLEAVLEEEHRIVVVHARGVALEEHCIVLGVAPRERHIALCPWLAAVLEEQSIAAMKIDRAEVLRAAQSQKPVSYPEEVLKEQSS
jgi:hypothetical protein